MQYSKQLFGASSVAAVLLTGFSISLPLTAQTIEEVTVQAEFQDDAALDDLVSASVLDAEKLADAGIENVEDVAAYVPNLVLTQTETGTSIFIRGIGAGVNQGFDQSVGLYIDRVPLPRANMSRAPFLDLQNVQVLRGPQYVKDGNYSIAGSVHMVSNLSLDEFSAGIDLNYVPSQDDKKLIFTAGMPFNDYFAGRIAIQAKNSDGYMENVTRDEDGPQQEELITRLVFGFNPTEDLSFKLKVERGDYDTIGRAAEIILDEKAPQPPHPPTIPRVKLASTWQPNSPLLDAHKRLRALSIQYNTRSLYGGPPDSLTGEFWFANKSYLELLDSIYRGNYTDIPYSEVRDFRQGTYPTGDYPSIEPPRGLTDATLNYKRGADAEEFSNNKSTNYTLNTDLWLGDHKLLLTSSYIEYEFDEQIDSDFTAAPLFVSRQSEEYEQIFQRIDYESPEGNFIQLKAGVSYLDSKLTFKDVTKPQLASTLSTASGSDKFLLFPKLETGQFAPETLATAEPFRVFFGGLDQTGIEYLEEFSIDRLFKQDAETLAAYFETTINWSESFRTILGARYTRAEKTALRDLAFLDENGEGPSPAVLTDEQRQNLFFFFGSRLGIQLHSDRVEADVADNVLRLSRGSDPNYDQDECIGPTQDLCAMRGKRTEETLLPSIAFEWDINDDLSLLISVRKANKLGGFDARANTVPRSKPNAGLPGGSFEFFDENATTYETGVKWFLPGGWGELNATAFLTKFKDLQVSRFDGKSGFNVANASAATTTGIEVEGLLTFNDAFNINYSLAWIDFEFNDFDLAACHLGRAPENFLLVSDVNPPLNIRSPSGGVVGSVNTAGTIIPILYDFVREAQPSTFPWIGRSNVDFVNEYDTSLLASPGLCDFDGQTNQFVADWQGTFSFNYQTELIGLGLLKPTLDVLYNSGYYTSGSQDPLSAQEEYVQLNGRIELASFEDTWSVALTGENLTDRKIISYSNETPLGARVQGSRGFVGFIRPPRSIGINLRYKFY